MKATSSPQTYRSRWLIVLGFVLVALLVVFSLILWAAPNPQAGSTYGRSLTGYRQWYDYMIQRQIPVKRWRRRYDQLSGSGQTLIRIGGQASLGAPVSLNAFDENAADLTQWVEKGNTLIQLRWQGQVTEAPFISQLPTENHLVQIETTRRYRADTQSRTSLQRRASQQIETIVKDQHGVAVWSQPLGKGTLISCVYPWLAANALVDQADNYRFLASLAQQRGGPIWIDEWMHGYRDPDPAEENASAPQDFIAYLLRTPVAVMVAQLSFMVLLLIWGHNHRFGNLITIKPALRNTSEQYIEALASTMNAARKTEFATETLGQSIQKSLATQLGLMSPYSHQIPDLETLSTQWTHTTGRPAQELLELLQPTVRSDRDLVAWIANVESLLRELP